MPKVNIFYSNEEDNLHCLQSCFRMVYHTIFNEELSLNIAEDYTNFEVNVPTWPFKAMLSLCKLGLTVKHYERFDPHLFIDSPVQAITNLFNDQSIAEKVLIHTNIPNEQMIVAECLNSEKVEFIVRTPTLSDISKLLDDGYFVICNINYWTLLGLDEYAGHFVIVEEVTSDIVKIQNPGLPPIENQIVDKSLFEKSFHYPNSESGNIIAIRNDR